ncbi:MAG: A24 family peptidase [Coriobacteriia bacterium]|nr:A24 family peptidase [Coriobacteriia bacterium]MCL2745972.1 A24 family peptidase [Coriobacteriia bacterium]MCL2870780.1 A24 family peptidase [Coriobacteriia bacterium]
MDYITPIVIVCLFGLLAWLSYFDVLERRLPNQLVLAVVVLGAGLALRQSLFISSLSPLQDALIGALLAAGPALLFSFIYHLVRRQDGFGAGDIKLLAALGLFFGPAGVMLLPIASLLAAMVTLPQMFAASLRAKLKTQTAPPFSEEVVPASENTPTVPSAINKAQGQTIAFGPYISLAAFVVLLMAQLF